METNTNPTHKEVKLNQTLKIFLKRAIVHVAITNVEGGEEQRQLKAIGDKGDSTETLTYFLSFMYLPYQDRNDVIDTSFFLEHVFFSSKKKHLPLSCYFKIAWCMYLP